jgi:hypothetical protein
VSTRILAAAIDEKKSPQSHFQLRNFSVDRLLPPVVAAAGRITSSITNFMAAGRTSPAARTTGTRTMPAAKCARHGRIRRHTNLKL